MISSSMLSRTADVDPRGVFIVQLGLHRADGDHPNRLGVPDHHAVVRTTGTVASVAVWAKS